MEVQRRQGCCIQMQKLRALLVPAVVEGTNETAASVPRTTCDFLESLVEKKSAMTADPRQECLPSALKICSSLLKSQRLDENRLGLESLVTLTDPSKVAAKDADKACQLVLSDKTYQDLLDKYFCDMQKCPKPQDDDDLMDYEQGPFFGSLHLLALKVLVHALESAVHKKAPIDMNQPFWTSSLQALVYNLSVASHRPLEASLSIKCLRLLQTVEPSCISGYELEEFLSTAHQYGRDHSVSLEQETEQLMGRLEQYVH